MFNPQSSQNSANLLNEASGLQQVEITINGIQIKDEYLQDIEIDYDGGFEIKGYFVVNDIYDLQTQAFISPGQIANVKYMDQHKDEFERDFMILRSSETKMQDFKGINFQIQDIASWKLKNTFEPKSWEETTLVDVFNYILNLEVKPLIPKIKIIQTPGRTLKHFCIPLNVNFLEFITEEFRKEGTFFYQTRDSIIIGDTDIPETPQFPYKQTGSEETYGFVVMEHYLTFNNIMETNKVLPKTQFIVYDNTKKLVERYDKSLSDYKESLKLSGKAFNSQLTYNRRDSTQEYLVDTTKYKHLYYHNNSQLTIYVPGNVKYSILYKKIDVYLSGNVMADDTRETGDYKVSGKYMIMGVEDKIIVGQKFIQKLSLKRLNEEEKS